LTPSHANHEPHPRPQQKDRWTYNAAKGAVNQLTKRQALDLAPFNIHVNNVDPGWIWSNETDKAANLDGGGRTKWDPIWGKYHMLRRLGLAVEVAHPTLFLLSDDASFITGTTLMVDGGYPPQHLSSRPRSRISLIRGGVARVSALNLLPCWRRRLTTNPLPFVISYQSCVPGGKTVGTGVAL
jgi:hypothetical protein